MTVVVNIDDWFDMRFVEKYTFSGHESFPCKSLWLKKGYDYETAGEDFNDPQAVVKLGVGKNMVSSIRYWLKSFGLNKESKTRWIADYLLGEQGTDPYIEDDGTLWLLHYLLISTGEATLYQWVFSDFQKKKRHFKRADIVSYVKAKLLNEGRLSQFNENTVSKDVGVLLQNYCAHGEVKNNELYSSLLLDLNLIISIDKDEYAFNEDGRTAVPPEIFFFSVLTEKGDDLSVTFEDTLKRIGLIYCMTDLEIISCLKSISEKFSGIVSYSDVAGVRQLLFSKDITPKEILEVYYA